MYNYILLGPGPVNLHPKVKEAAISVDLSHRQEEFIEILMSVKNKLRRIFCKDDYFVSILHGSGSLSVEAALQSLVQGDVLVIDNGPYSKKIINSVDKSRNNVFCLELKDGEYPAPNKIQSFLRRRYDWVVMVHHETGTGLLNPLSEICDLFEQTGTKIFVDAVSSAGVHDIDKRCNVICLNSNKCLESIPGAAIVIWDRSLGVNKDVLPYLRIKDYIADNIPCTLNTNAIMALDVALDLYLVEDRPKRYEEISSYIREIGCKYFEPFLKSHYSNVLTSFLVGRKSYKKIYEKAKKAGFILYPGNTWDQFRVCNLGYSLTKKDIDRLFKNIGKY